MHIVYNHDTFEAIVANNHTALGSSLEGLSIGADWSLFYKQVVS